MTEQQFDDESANSGGDEQQWLKDLRKKARERDQFETQLQQYQQRDEIRQVDGLQGLTDKQIKALTAAAGESTPDAWKSTAEELGFYKAEPEVDPKIQQGHEQVAAASQGATIQPTPFQSGDDPYAGAASAEEVMRLAAERGSATTWG